MQQMRGALACCAASADWRPPVLTLSALTAARASPPSGGDLRYRDAAGKRRTGAKRRRQALDWMWTLIDAGLRSRFRHHAGVRARWNPRQSLRHGGQHDPGRGGAPPAGGAICSDGNYGGFTGGTMHDIIRQLDEKRAAARLGGGQKRIDAQHARAS
jgi:hypothetical protein